MFTGEACNYKAILTNDYELTDDEVVFFYNQRGVIEREFDVLKNDFGWNNMPFSKLEQNTVFLMFSAICRNIYHHIINSFSKRYDFLKPHYRIKKFIFRFICIPAKWITGGR
ncbi:MAG: transposase [Marinilabiliaceae bacterium]|nr:transposase [Marinilabiliaceae bacterium]